MIFENCKECIFSTIVKGISGNEYILCDDHACQKEQKESGADMRKGEQE